MCEQGQRRNVRRSPLHKRLLLKPSDLYWRKLPRVVPLRKAEEERLRAEHAAALAGFRALLSERHDITTATHWAKVKDDLRSDLRYRAVKRDDREKAFDAYIAELRAAEQEVEHAGKSKKDKEEKVRGKEREQRKRKDREEEELERVRLKAPHKDVVTAYQALLKEKIKDLEASWTDARPKLERDGLGRASNPDLDLPEREKLFQEHVNDLYEYWINQKSYTWEDAAFITGHYIKIQSKSLDHDVESL